MKRFLTLVVAALVALNSFGQEKTVDEIIAKLKTNLVNFSYSCTVTDKAPIKLDGTVMAQQDCYVAKGNGLEIYCDGKTRWTVDREAKEVYIEKSGGLVEILAQKDSIKDLKISKLVYKPLSGSRSAFTFNVSALDKTWVITDLRTE